jgi:hypothetical protein
MTGYMHNWAEERFVDFINNNVKEGDQLAEEITKESQSAGLRVYDIRSQVYDNVLNISRKYSGIQR